MECFEFAAYVSVIPFILRIISLGNEDRIAKGVAAKGFPTFAHTAFSV